LNNGDNGYNNNNGDNGYNNKYDEDGEDKDDKGWE
jgi:hypothetical protein